MARFDRRLDLQLDKRHTQTTITQSTPNLPQVPTSCWAATPTAQLLSIDAADFEVVSSLFAEHPPPFLGTDILLGGNADFMARLKLREMLMPEVVSNVEEEGNGAKGGKPLKVRCWGTVLCAVLY